VNLGEAMSLSGTELNYQQALTFLPSWARGFSIFANGTLLRKDGPDATFTSLYRRTANWGGRYSRARFSAGMNWNNLSSRSLPFGPPNGVRHTKPSTTLDLNAEFRITPQVSVYYNARNITNAKYRREVFNSLTPAYARPYQDIENGSKMSVGVRARF
jgi:outer membrane receptor protein involved in Fe transport